MPTSHRAITSTIPQCRAPTAAPGGRAPRVAAPRLLVLGVAVAVAAVTVLAVADPAAAALQKIAGYERSGDNRFGSLFGYFSNLRDAILPLSIPIGSIGLIVGGAMYVFGSPQASRLLFGVIVGLGLVMLAPSIIA